MDKNYSNMELNDISEIRPIISDVDSTWNDTLEINYNSLIGLHVNSIILNENTYNYELKNNKLEVRKYSKDNCQMYNMIIEKDQNDKHKIMIFDIDNEGYYPKKTTIYYDFIMSISYTKNDVDSNQNDVKIEFIIGKFTKDIVLNNLALHHAELINNFVTNNNLEKYKKN